MYNNGYTSPRTYASRGKRSKVKTKRTYFEQGMGYTKPPGMTQAEFKSLYSEWEQKLRKSGFNDLEYRSPSHTGHFTPFFRQNGSSATFAALYNPATERYYALCRDFATYMDLRISVSDGATNAKLRLTRWEWVFGTKAHMYKHLWYLHSEGLPFREVVKHLRGDKVKSTYDLKPTPPRLVSNKSIFWAHDHTHRVLDLFWKWANDTEGLKDPRNR